MSYMFFYEKINKEILNLKNCTVKSIGKSVLNRDIFAVYIGSGKNKIIVQYGIHAREYITTHLALLHIHFLLTKKIDGQIIIVPQSNPDGASLCVDGLASVPEKYHSFLKKVNGSDNFSLWKANVNAVDLNVNFDAKWGKGLKNVFYENFENYVGKAPCDQSETKALCNLVEIEKPLATISYHSKGEEIYYKFFQKHKERKRDLLFAKEIANLTGYKICDAPFSVGGFKDWCILKHHIPSFTIEVGSDKLSHPISTNFLCDIWQQNKLVPEKILALCNKFLYNMG